MGVRCGFAKWCQSVIPRDRIVCPHRTLMFDSFSCIPFDFKCFILKVTFITTHFDVGQSDIFKFDIIVMSQWQSYMTSYTTDANQIHMKIFLFSSPEPKAYWWACRIGRLPSSVCLSVYLSSTLFKHLLKNHCADWSYCADWSQMESPWDGGTKICFKDPGHMTKMAAILGTLVQNIRILHGCEVRLCQVMPISDPEGQNCLSAPNTHVWFFFLHTFRFQMFYFKSNIHYHTLWRRTIRHF